MDFPILRVQMDDGAIRPVRSHRYDAGLDLGCPHDVTVPARGKADIDTGIHVAIEPGWFGKLESRSGLAVNHGVICVGGVVDSGYTGSIVVSLYNLSDEDYRLLQGDRCAQMVLIPCAVPMIQVVGSISESERGDGGFGSTGR